ncbi:hypothetical protein B0E38_01821 [Streptomyces sp. 111WW2]|uniref:hypothetical protein n=1 Tax=Streptomyces sp. 111WW2 TaxID=1945515 RepID=UPI000D0C8BB3|nr:hypothetical protein [Streptomyces sp. 111WW2]PSK57976.1 hypothetical protein B0E38_01821 [Streptomyces sp. 111WW2]
MSNPTVPPLTAEAPWGHSSAAHRAHGFCSDCHGRSTVDELVAWRVAENRRHEADQAVLTASAADPSPITLTAERDRPCPACGREALTVVTVALVVDSGESRTAGGWAHCTACDAIPHPLWESPPPDDEDSALPFFVACDASTSRCPTCRADDALLTAVFTATMKSGVHEIGRWQYCLACDDSPNPTMEDVPRG